MEGSRDGEGGRQRCRGGGRGRERMEKVREEWRGR
jgi:hypothetical protein